MVSPKDWAIPEGSTILVTGANGFIGSHIADQFLHYGFSVRGTVRDVSKNAWLADVFQERYGSGRFSLHQVSDLAAKGAFDEVIKGVSTVAHSASIMTLDHDPNKVIPHVIAFALNALKAAYAELSVKRFVFCSSSTAVVLATLDKPGIVIDERTWNEEAVKKAWADPPYTPERSHAVYAASKVLAEQAIWAYQTEHNEERPDMVINTVLPNMTFGTPLHLAGYTSTATMIPFLYRGEIVEYHRLVPRQYFIDVQDIGRLHVAGVLDKVRGQRIFAFAERYSWDAVLDILRNLEPAKTFPENFSGGEDPNEILPRPKAEQMLRDLGRAGWTSLEESVRTLVENLRKIDAGSLS